jgi:hypothetical protein
MIIKSSRISRGRTKALTSYFSSKGDNQSVCWRYGGVRDIAWMALPAQITGQVFQVRHVIIAPEMELSMTDLAAATKAVCEEYGVSHLARGQVCIVEHVKATQGQLKAIPHFHLLLPEYDVGRGRVMDSRFTRMRDEKLSRMLELRFEHPSRAGQFNKEVYSGLQEEFPGLCLIPFQQILKQMSVEAGLSARDWLSFRAKAPAPAKSWMARRRDAKSVALLEDVNGLQMSRFF